MDVEKLLKALDNNENEVLLNFTTEKIKEMNFNILKELHLSQNKTVELYNKLKDYKYVDELTDLKYGTYIRWICIEKPNDIFLTKGAIFCEFKQKNENTFCVCKNYGFNTKHFQISIDKNLIFQKLTSQELVLLSALDHLSN